MLPQMYRSICSLKHIQVCTEILVLPPHRCRKAGVDTDRGSHVSFDLPLQASPFIIITTITIIIIIRFQSED
jgi:hypothetical protein